MDTENACGWQECNAANLEFVSNKAKYVSVNAKYHPHSLVCRSLGVPMSDVEIGILTVC